MVTVTATDERVSAAMPRVARYHYGFPDKGHSNRHVVIGRIRHFMDVNGKTQADIVEGARNARKPIGRATVSRILAGKADLRNSSLEAIAAGLGCTPQELQGVPRKPSDIPEPQRLGSVVFIPLVRFMNGEFVLDPMGDSIPAPGAFFAPGTHLLAYEVDRDVGMQPDIMAGDLLFIETGRLPQNGEMVVVPDQMDESSNSIRIGLAQREHTGYSVANNTGTPVVAADLIAGIVRRVIRDARRRGAKRA